MIRLRVSKVVLIRVKNCKFEADFSWHLLHVLNSLLLQMDNMFLLDGKYDLNPIKILQKCILNGHSEQAEYPYG